MIHKADLSVIILWINWPLYPQLSTFITQSVSDFYSRWFQTLINDKVLSELSKFSASHRLPLKKPSLSISSGFLRRTQSLVFPCSSIGSNFKMLTRAYPVGLAPFNLAKSKTVPQSRKKAQLKELLMTSLMSRSLSIWKISRQSLTKTSPMRFSCSQPRPTATFRPFFHSEKATLSTLLTLTSNQIGIKQCLQTYTSKICLRFSKSQSWRFSCQSW